jgi:hemoglobin-like flavoprotein
MTEDGLQPLTETQVALLKKTFRSVDTDRLAMRFYTSLFVKYPNLKSLFPSDLTELSTKIVSVFELIVFSFQKKEDGRYFLQHDVLLPLKSLGQLHAKKGVESKHYPLVNEMLLQSLRYESPEFTIETELAWKLALNHLTVAMLNDSVMKPDEEYSSMRESYQHIKSLLFKVSE